MRAHMNDAAAVSTSRPVVGRPTVDTSDRRPWAFGEEDTLCIDAWCRCDAFIHAQKVLGTVIYTGLAAAAAACSRLGRY
jgi:hypothetical protein